MILNSLSVHGASSLQDLHAHTMLPKSTIRRLLGTLIRRKVVRRSLNDQLYRANVSLPLQDKKASRQGEGWLVDCAVPHMIELTRSIGWSCDLHIFQRTRSRIIESTRPLSPFFQYDRHIDLEVPVFASAAGLAVLSTWSNAAVLRLVDETKDDPVWGLRRLGIASKDLLSNLQAIRGVGYAVRASQWRAETPLADALTAIARPIHRGETAVGALAILWPKGFLDAERFASLHLKNLSEAAATISAELTETDRHDKGDVQTVQTSSESRPVSFFKGAR
jgi:IclR family mhp operon transcriptional activator